MSDTTIRTGKGSEILAQCRYYDDTYLIGDDDGSCMLFILDAAVVKTPSGRENLRTNRDLVVFESVDVLVEAVTSDGWVMAPIEDGWKPRREEVEQCMVVG